LAATPGTAERTEIGAHGAVVLWRRHAVAELVLSSDPTILELQ
jgi:hypothetical protein